MRLFTKPRTADATAWWQRKSMRAGRRCHASARFPYEQDYGGLCYPTHSPERRRMDGARRWYANKGFKKPAARSRSGQRQPDGGASSLVIFPIDKANFSSVGARDLLCEGEAYTAAGWLGCVERHKQVLAVGDSQAAVFNENLD